MATFWNPKTDIEIKVGQVWRVKTGEKLCLVDLDEATFLARLWSPKIQDWTDYHLEGESYKLPLYLLDNEAVLEP